MKQLLIFIFCICSLALSAFSDDYIYLSSGGANPSLSVYEFSSAEEKLKLIQEIPLEYSPGVSTVSADGKFYYVTLRGRKKPSRLVTYSILPDGKLKEVHAIDAASYGYISLDPKGEYLWGVSGNVHAHKIEKGLCKKSVASAPVVRGSHSVRSGHKGEFVYIPHIIANKMYQYRFDRDKEKFNALNPLTVDGPDSKSLMSDPRHLMFHSKLNIVYTSNEIRGGISSWKVNENSGKLTLWQTESTLTDGFDWDNRASDIYLSSDDLFAYVANRDNTDRKSSTGNDSIAVFKLNSKSGALSKCIQREKTGRHVRSLIIDSSGKYLLATGVWSADFSIYRRDSVSGQLEFIKKQKCKESPMWMSLKKK